MMTSGGHDKVVRVGETFVIAGQDGHRLDDRPDQNPGISGGQQSDVGGQDGIVALGKSLAGQAWVAQVSSIRISCLPGR